MANRVYVGDDDLMYEIYDGDQNGITVQAMVDMAWPIVEKRRAAKQPVLVLADIRAIGHVSLEARRAAARALTGWPYDKIALFGANTYLHHIANLIIIATRRQGKVRLFRDLASAKRWLKGENEPHAK